VKSLSSLVSANRVDASGWEGWECCSQCSIGERHSVIEEIQTGETQEDTDMKKVGGGQRKESAIFD